MSAAPELRYTDRDVRDDPSLVDLAVAYVMNYTGEFEPLVDAKEYLEEEGELTIALTRKVLNCMRHDANVMSRLPRPQRRDNVVDLAPRRKKKENTNKPCSDTQPHYVHRWGGEDNPYKYYCEGVDWPINRGRIVRPAKVKVPYVASRTGVLIHDVMPGGPHWSIWQGPTHEYGYRTDEHPWYNSAADLSVKLLCKFPSRLENPILIKGNELEKYMEIEDALKGLRRMSMCPYCADVRAGS